MFIFKTRNILNLNDFNEYVKSLIPKIEIVLKIGSDSLRFTLSEALTVEEDDLLSDAVLSYLDIDPELSYPKIYDICRDEVKTKHFHDINYKNELRSGYSLIPKRTVVKGEVIAVDWYLSIGANQQPENLILKTEINYNRDVTGFATYRTTTRTWYNRNNEANSEVKHTSKFYFVNPSDMIDEGIKRRSLLVKTIQIPVMTFMMEVLMPQGVTQASVVLKGRSFMDAYENLFNKFKDNSSTVTDPSSENFGEKNIIVSLRDNTSEGINKDYNSWLDLAPNSLGGSKTIRQYLIEEFSI